MIRFPLDDSTVLPFPSALTVEISFYLRHFASGEARLLFYEGRYFRVRMFSTLVFTQGESVRNGESHAEIFSNIVMCSASRFLKKTSERFCVSPPGFKYSNTKIANRIRCKTTLSERDSIRALRLEHDWSHGFSPQTHVKLFGSLNGQHNSLESGPCEWRLFCGI